MTDIENLDCKVEALLARLNSGPLPARNRPTAGLLESERVAASDEASTAFSAGVRAALRIVWDDGPRPASALKHLIVLTQIIAPDLTLHMTDDELAELSAETKQAWSKRMIAFYERHLRGKNVIVPSMKSDEARDAMSEGKEGRKHRQG